MSATTASPLPSPQSERRAAGAGRLIRVLLVEDDDDIRLLLTLTLQREGYDVTAVATADHALAVMASRRQDLILTDYCLPRKDGLEFVAEAQSTGVLAKAPVIVCTAFPPGQTDGVTVVEKPIDVDALMAEIRKALRR
jgi:two-component system response regulator GlrR